MEKSTKTLTRTGEPQAKYPHRLNFYEKPPLGDVSLEDFENFALARLRVLSEIESSIARNRSGSDLLKATHEQSMKYIYLGKNDGSVIMRDAQRRKDHLGHYVLRLAFCRSEDLRARFVKAETILFKSRYEMCDGSEKEEFLKERKVNWTIVTPDEKLLFDQDLTACYQKGSVSFQSEVYYKVRWMQVPDLVEKRKVFINGGWAFVPSSEQSSIFFREFETKLTRAMEMTARSFPRLDEDSRLVPILNNLSGGFIAGVTSEWNAPNEGEHGKITADMIDDLSKKHFPMCMRSLHNHLRKDHHLKHFGRLQYGLFLKVLGLSIEEAIYFWKKSFSRITEEKFNKEYKYNIRHSYGLEGKRANYPAKSCQQILTSGASDHGCPYRHYSLENLQTALLSEYSSQGLTVADLPEIIAIVKSGLHHVACTRVFEITHGGCGVKKGDGIGGGESVTHPNQYAARSIELEKTVKDSPAKMVVD